MLPSATECRINEPSAPKSSQNPQYKRPCGSGKKYKQCCGK
nr:SEC-C domain-containing protein [Bacilli bacterium]